MGNTSNANSPSISPTSASPKNNGGRKSLSRKYSQIFQRRKSSIKQGGCNNSDISQCQSFIRLKQILTFYYKYIEEHTSFYKPRFSLMSRQQSTISDYGGGGIGHLPQDSVMSVGIPADLLQLTTNMSLPTLDAPTMSPISIQEILARDEERKQQYQPPQKEDYKQSIYEYINNKFEKGSYSNCDLLNDFNHCLKYHDSDEDFEFCYNNLISLICKECDINQCLMIKRNYRNRINLGTSQNIDKRTDIYFGDDYKEINIQQILDKIHCFYYHSYQMGFRLNANIKLSVWDQNDDDNDDNDKSLGGGGGSNNNTLSNGFDVYQFLEQGTNLDENKEIEDNKNKKEKDDNKPDKLSIKSKDKKLISLRDIIREKKKNYISIGSSARFKSNNRYFSDISVKFNDESNPCFYYWEYYKNKKDSDKNNKGYNYSDWFVQSRFYDLKEELIDNSLCSISINQFNDLSEKASNFIETQSIKSLICNVDYHLNDYGIKIEDKIGENHIISIIVYTSFENLRNELQKTYIYKSSKERENNKFIIKRHCQFANIGRLLRECVECFGIQTKNSKIQTFFHGITPNISISDISVIIKCPFSSSSQIETILNYQNTENNLQKNGLLLKLNGDFSGYSTYFQCKLLSDFCNEYEQVWIGGNFPLIYKNITEMSSGKNLKIYFYSLYVIQSMFDGVYFEINKQNLNQESWKSIQEIVKKLLNHQLYRVNNNSDKDEEDKDDDEKGDGSSSDDSCDDSDEEEEEESFVDEEEIVAKRQKQQLIARRPSSKAFKRSSFKPPTRELPALPKNLQKNIMKKEEKDDDKKNKKEEKKKVNKYKKFKDIPKYIEKLLNKQCKSLTELKFDYMRMNKEKSKSMPNYRGYKFCGDMFCLYKIEWIKLPVILQLFPNLESIEIWGNIELNTKIFDYILIILVTEINKTIKNNQDLDKNEAMKLLKLKEIKIDEPLEEEISIKKSIKKYKNKFKKIGWKMYEQDEQLIITSKDNQEDEEEEEEEEEEEDEYEEDED